MTIQVTASPSAAAHLGSGSVSRGQHVTRVTHSFMACPSIPTLCDKEGAGSHGRKDSARLEHVVLVPVDWCDTADSGGVGLGSRGSGDRQSRVRSGPTRSARRAGLLPTRFRLGLGLCSMARCWRQRFAFLGLVQLVWQSSSCDDDRDNVARTGGPHARQFVV